MVPSLEVRIGYLPNHQLLGEGGIPTSSCTKILLRERNDKLLKEKFMKLFLISEHLQCNNDTPYLCRGVSIGLPLGLTLTNFKT